MKMRVLALDYDGTIAHNGALDSDVRSAIQEARRRGIVVLIVTGRRVDDLQRVLGDLRIVNVVVAENGAVILFPSSGRIVRLGQPPPAAFVMELERRQIDVGVGECVIEADASLAPPILAVIRSLQLPWMIAFNRGRLMVLPQSINKATGLRAALRMLRLSAHNALAIGDAENDHELLASCEVGAAVAWGSLPLQESADVVIPGEGPQAVAPFVREVVAQEQLPMGKAAKQGILLGYEGDGRPLSLAMRGHNLLIAGQSRTGKSSLAGVLAEQLLLQRYCICVIDPEGDHDALEELPGVIVWHVQSHDVVVEDLVRVLRYPDMSLVLDLSALALDERCTVGTALLHALASIRRRTGLPHRVVVDEAHYFLHEPASVELMTPELPGYTLVTYRASELHADVRALSDVVIVTSAMDAHEANALLAATCSPEQALDVQQLVHALSVGMAVLLPGCIEARDGPRQFRIAPRLTSHVRHRHKYLDVPVADERAFIFTDRGVPTGQRARTLHEFVALLGRVAPSVVGEHMKRGDFSRWIADVFGDVSTAASIRELELHYRSGQISCPAQSLQARIEDHYGIEEENI